MGFDLVWRGLDRRRRNAPVRRGVHGPSNCPRGLRSISLSPTTWNPAAAHGTACPLRRSRIRSLPDGDAYSAPQIDRPPTDGEPNPGDWHGDGNRLDRRRTWKHEGASAWPASTFGIATYRR